MLPNRGFVCLIWKCLSLLYQLFELSIILVLIFLVLGQFDACDCHTLRLAIIDSGENVGLSYFNLLNFLIQNDLILMLIFHSVQIHYKMCYRSKSKILVIISLYLGLSGFQRLWINRKSFNITSPILFSWWSMKIDTGECHARAYKRSGNVDEDFYCKDLGKLPEEKIYFKTIMLSQDF